MLTLLNSVSSLLWALWFLPDGWGDSPSMPFVSLCLCVCYKPRCLFQNRDCSHLWTIENSGIIITTMSLNVSFWREVLRQKRSLKLWCAVLVAEKYDMYFFKLFLFLF